MPHLITAGGGSIVTISSIVAHRVLRSSPAYVTSKAAVEGLARQIAQDYAGDGIRSNVIVLGSVRTPQNAAAHDDPVVGAARRASRMIAEPGTVQDVASLVAFLASDEARYMTAALVPLDGGALATYGGLPTSQLTAQASAVEDGR